ncbi:DUF4129 domain-containing protein [Lederbergia galactosidilytica]|uniref:DUF4129 domain-containing protein n=1 Tax=Lederbergia galactosidilytica TaxID=217031 RepID=A0A0Q9Y000_9BACI|nr:DUF4129 domain-containing protein [Lederbergia galactosidilytica]KRG09681.1 hypothetical protein ACA29_20725 [Lederbergia galactosidilytica]KRG12037.1 hypothetical protein ACA30_20575 [Virgibacillus soli]MBP1913500.1 hypothetical protein [Lederbergia galactosidilytica]OAK72179.1 hypothetical protein ABB05_09070 [Lederbergia galactosidilytica]
MLEPDKARQDLEKILDSKEYQVYNIEKENTLQIWWSKAKQWLMDQLENLFPSAGMVETSASILLIIFIALVVLLVTVIVILIIRYSVRKTKFRNKRPLQKLSEMEWSYQTHITEVKKLEEIGDYEKATRHLFLALLLYFNQCGWLKAKMWKTNWEYYAELKKTQPTWAQKFYNLAHFFDKVTYGEHQIEKTEYEDYKKDIIVGLEARVQKEG